MDYVNVHMPDGISDLSEEELRHEIDLRRGVHMLRSNAANALRGLITFEPQKQLQPLTIPTYFNEMRDEACRNPVELARLILLEQVLIGKHLVSCMAFEAGQSDTYEACSAYSTAVAKLQAELRRNVKCLAEIPPVEAIPEQDRNFLVESEMLDQFGEKQPGTKEVENSVESQKNARVTEQGSKLAGQKSPAATESTQSSPGRSRPTQPYASQGPFRGGPQEASGISFAAQAMDEIFGPQNGRGQTPGSKKRPSRKKDVKTENRPRAETPEETARRHAAITQLFSGMVPMHIGRD